MLVLFETKPGMGGAQGASLAAGHALQTPLKPGSLDVGGPEQSCVLADPPKEAYCLVKPEGRHHAVYTRILK